VTTLLCWLSVDARGPSAVYIVTDSRITWGSTSRRWDSGRKVFAARSADIFGYCGEVLFPSLVLGQLVDLADRGVLWEDGCLAEVRHSIILRYLQTSSRRRHNTPEQDFTIVHCSRDGEKLGSTFRAWIIQYKATGRKWKVQAVDTGGGERSKLLLSLGSGRKWLSDEIDAWARSPQGEVARGIFSAFCDALDSKKDPLSGGVPQIVALDRVSPGKVLGFVAEGIRYIHGLPVEPVPGLTEMEWVDRLFQRISPVTLKLLSGAQRHARVTAPQTNGLSTFLRRTKN
jgi:hypothetical protein